MHICTCPINPCWNKQVHRSDHNNKKYWHYSASEDSTIKNNTHKITHKLSLLSKVNHEISNTTMPKAEAYQHTTQNLFTEHIKMYKVNTFKQTSVQGQSFTLKHGIINRQVDHYRGSLLPKHGTTARHTAVLEGKPDTLT